jgi:hypothetical protein
MIRGAGGLRRGARVPIFDCQPDRLDRRMSPTWIWTQIAIVVFVVIGMVIAITKLA